MTDKAREEMSALMDGEATELELHRVLKCCETDDELRASWRRYHVMRSVIRGEARDKTVLPGVLPSASLDIAAAVSKAIADEPSYSEPTEVKQKDRPWVDKVLRPFGSVAVAASVSAMVIFGWQSTGGFESQQIPSGVPIAASSSYSAPTYSASNSSPSSAIPTNIAPAYLPARASGYILADDSGQSVSRAGTIPSQDVIRLKVPRDDRFNSYILSHSGNAAFNTVGGVMPYARVVTLKPSTLKPSARSLAK